MPLASNGLSDLIEEKKLTTEQWILLILGLQELIAPHIKNWKCSALKNMNIMRHEALYTGQLNFEEMCWMGEPIVSAKNKLSLSTRGIFSTVESNYERISGDGTRKIWGFTRSGKWILARLEYSVVDRGDKYEKADRLWLTETGLTDLVCAYGIKPQAIWDILSNEVRKWHESREILAKESNYVFREVQFRTRIILFKEPRTR